MVRAAAAVSLLAAGCTWYEPRPLERAEEVAARPSPDATRIRVEVADLHHPRLAPLEIHLEDGLGPLEAAVLAVVGNPDLAAAREAHGEAEAGVVAAGLLPNPSFGADLLAPYGSGSAGTVMMRVLTLSVDTASLITRGARLDAERATLASVDLGITWQEWQVAEAARLDTVRLGWIRRRLEIAREEAASLEEHQRRLAAAVERGDATWVDLGVQRAALEAARQIVRELERLDTGTESRLLAELGWRPDAALRIEVPSRDALPERAIPSTAVAVEACLPQRLDLEGLRRGYDAQDARFRQAVLEQLPSVSVGVAHERNETALNFFGGSVAVSLPVFDHAQARIALAEATRARLLREYEARVLAMRQELDEILRALRLIVRQGGEVDAALPELEALEHVQRRALERGDVDQVSYQTVRSSLFELRLARDVLAQSEQEAEVGLVLGCGGPLPWNA